MHITAHAADRIQQRNIREDQMNIVLEHGTWNSRGDRLTLGRRQARVLLEERRGELRAMERSRQSVAKSAFLRDGE